MAAYNKFNVFVQNLSHKVMDLHGSPPADTLKVMLSDVAPVATNAVKADITEIAGGNGYTAGGTALTNPAGTTSGGTETLAADQWVVTAAGGAIAQFRYVVLFDDTPSSPLKPLIAWWDYGSELNLNSGDSLTVKFNNASAAGTIYTLA